MGVGLTEEPGVPEGTLGRVAALNASPAGQNPPPAHPQGPESPPPRSGTGPPAAITCSTSASLSDLYLIINLMALETICIEKKYLRLPIQAFLYHPTSQEMVLPEWFK